MTPLLSYRQLGETGPDLICLHGLYGSGRNWQSIARSLSEHHRVWLPDQRNHGKSFQAEAWDYQVMAEDLGHLVAYLGIRQFALMGHSMGGKVAMQYALNPPDCAQGAVLTQLVLVDIAPKPYASDYHRELLLALNALDLQAIHSRDEADEALAKAIPAADVRRFLLSSLQRSDTGWQWQLNLPVLLANIDLITHNIDLSRAPFTGCPVLFAAGADSDYILPGDEDLIQQIFPLAQIAHIPGAGHWVQTDQPVALLALLKDFFAGTLETTP